MVATKTSQRMSAADASNIAIDAPDQVNAFLMAGVLAPGGVVGAAGAVDLEALRCVLGERLAAVPRMRQRVVRHGRRLYWEPVDLDLARHVRALAAVDGPAGFEALCGLLIVTPLSMARPLWEVLVVPGVGAGRSGLVVRIHHAMADGLAAVGILTALLDPVAKGAEGPDPQPGRVRIEVQPPAAHTGRGRSAARALRSGWQRTLAMVCGAVPDTALLGPLGCDRSVAFSSVELAALARGAQSVGATVNDALLAAVAVGVRDALGARGQAVPATLPASVPVALPNRGESGNAVGVMLVPLPLGRFESADRVRRVAEATRQRKADARSRGTMELTRNPLGARLFARLARRQRLVAMFVTNVPGPSRRLGLGGAPLERVWPVTALQGNVRLGVSALSYGGNLMCTVHADAAGVAASVVSAGLADELSRIAGLGSTPEPVDR